MVATALRVQGVSEPAATLAGTDRSDGLRNRLQPVDPRRRDPLAGRDRVGLLEKLLNLTGAATLSPNAA